MSRTAFRLPFTLLGIPVLLDITFLLFLPLLAWLIAAQIGQFAAVIGLPIDTAALQHSGIRYLLGLVIATAFFVSVVIHELGHSIIARLYNIPVKSITLWLLGGMAQFEQIPRQRGAEAVIAIAGPITSFLLAGLFWALYSLTPATWPASALTLAYIAEVNLVLAIFNLLPAMPLDGGRVLRSLLALRLPFLRATQVAASISKGLAILLGFVGLLVNPWLILIAFFVYIAVNAEMQQTLTADLLHGISVQDLMTRDVKTVTPDLTVDELTERMLQDHVTGYPVVDGQLLGIVTLNNIQQVEPTARVGEIMSSNPVTIPLNSSALDALQRMSQNDYNRLVVTDPEGHIAGIITKTDLMRALQLRMAGLLTHHHPASASGFPHSPSPLSS
ncbi:MAG TPA: site-2 protease family protein [Tepidisphaeraceae bacterium]|nr:site-2 protease family protein [Tepidisphaeraceae bacterium]